MRPQIPDLFTTNRTDVFVLMDFHVHHVCIFTARDLAAHSTLIPVHGCVGVPCPYVSGQPSDGAKRVITVLTDVPPHSSYRMLRMHVEKPVALCRPVDVIPGAYVFRSHRIELTVDHIHVQSFSRRERIFGVHVLVVLQPFPRLIDIHTVLAIVPHNPREFIVTVVALVLAEQTDIVEFLLTLGTLVHLTLVVELADMFQ